jgi:hypothetical protein
MMASVSDGTEDVHAAVAPDRAPLADPIVRVDLAGTVVFTIAAVIAAVVFTGPTRVLGVVVSLALFAVGVFAFLWGYFTAVQRSRTDEIAVAQLFFLTGSPTPRPVKRLMLGALAVQVVVAFATALTRTRTDGRVGSTLAFGILVPMFGIGLNGLWCARHGRFGERQRRVKPTADDADTDSTSVPTSDDEMEQNSRHG